MIDAVREFLEGDLMPTLQGRQQFHARVAVNVLGTVGRELRDGAREADAERARLVELLHVEDDGAEDQVEELSARLAAAIRSGEIAVDDPALLDHLRTTAREDLTIANPRYAPTEDG
jgi:hypothetical protein